MFICYLFQLSYNLFCFLVENMHVGHIEGHCDLVTHFVACPRIDPGNVFILSALQEQEDLIAHQFSQVNFSFNFLGDDRGRGEVGIMNILRSKSENDWFSNMAF